MAFEIAWLESARKELDAEIEYVYSEFGKDSARRARTKIKEAVDPLDTFPNSGMRCDGFMYHGHEVRMRCWNGEWFTETRLKALE